MWLSYHRAAIKLSCFCKKITRDYSFDTKEYDQKRVIDSQMPNLCVETFDGHAACGNYLRNCCLSENRSIQKFVYSFE